MDTIKSEIIFWPVQGSFRIARSEVTKVGVVVVSVTSGSHIGRGECRPYPRYDETPESVCAQVNGLRPALKELSLENLKDHLPNGAARNAIDCALWDLQSQISGKPVYELMALSAPRSRKTAFTLSLDSPEKMAKAAVEASEYELLKIKISGSSGVECALAVLNARPDVQLIIDANESLNAEELVAFQTVLAGKAVALIEQPLPASAALPQGIAGKLPPLCADESLHTRNDLRRLWKEGYRAVNIKLDKAGGLSEAHELAKTAKDMGFYIMLGCMVSSSLSMAPAMLLEGFADIIDLDGAALLSHDHEDGMIYETGHVCPAPKSLWGYPRKTSFN